MHDAATAALDLVGQQLQMAAFVPPGDDAGPALFGCSQGRVSGADASPACESLASRSDGVLVRYAADAVSTWPSASGAPTDCLGQAAGPYVVNRFYAKASGSTGEPELYCEGAGKQAQPVVEGVERLRIDFWLKARSSAAAGSRSIPPSPANACRRTSRADGASRPPSRDRARPPSRLSPSGRTPPGRRNV
jgi:type IV pilus assembly protein PilW